MHPDLTKERLRKKFLEMRREMTFEDVYRLSSIVQKRFVGTAYFKKGRHISLYSSFQNEVLTDEIFIEAGRGHKDIYYPKILKGKRHLEFFRVGDLGELSSGSYDIREPGSGDPPVSPAVFDLVVVPGVVFDLRGGRLGFGKGYYDRALKGLKCVVVALAYEFQVLGMNKKIPMEGHDVRVNAIVTEDRIITTE
ncbi:MAG: 5-formyltetrahydrofolate cyclo-ligase [Thermodesulfobacteriota bacterium]|nr:MAG: 5-formyltetrahydrofolate cyclo-ligase [Thermodesulfobacteriota bacterium]